MIELLNLTPAVGNTIAANAPIEFELRTPAASPFRRIIIGVGYAAYNTIEIAFAQNPVTSTKFENLYSQLSTAVAVTDAGFVRYKFSLRRDPLWPASPELVAYAFNTAGEEL